jgi:hypothetical protein
MGVRCARNVQGDTSHNSNIDFVVQSGYVTGAIDSSKGWRIPYERGVDCCRNLKDTQVRRKEPGAQRLNTS